MPDWNTPFSAPAPLEASRTKGEMERAEVTMVKRKMRQTAHTPSAQPSSSRLFLAMVTTQTKSMKP